MSGLEVRLDALASHLAWTGGRQHSLLLSHQVVTEGTRGALGASLAKTNGGRGWVLKMAMEIVDSSWNYSHLKWNYDGIGNFMVDFKAITMENGHGNSAFTH